MENNNNKTDDLYNRHLENIERFCNHLTIKHKNLISKAAEDISRLYSEEQNRELTIDLKMVSDKRNELLSTLSSRDEEIKRLKNSLLKIQLQCIGSAGETTDRIHKEAYSALTFNPY